ncbi:phosphotransferase [Micromonospora trifolii]|uniref:phosphotransferase n=1 Tax=Micromonospora trifolii TaxID=2911208 RepID=UPI003CF282A9
MARYTVLTERQIADVLRQYGWQDANVEVLAGGAANSSYTVRTSTSHYVVTILDNHDQVTAHRLAALLRHLARFELPTSRLVRTLDGADLGVFGDLSVLAKEYIPGSSAVPLPDSGYVAAGKLLASAHRVPAPDWLAGQDRRLPTEARSRLREFHDRAFAAWVAKQLNETETQLGFEGPRGLVHGDFFADNLVTGPDGMLHVIDWETAAVDLFCIDIGMALVGLCGHQGRFLPQRMAAFLNGYAAIRRLDPTELKALPAATIYAATMIAYFRYVRHHLSRPDPTKQYQYREMVDLVSSIKATFMPPRGLLNN